METENRNYNRYLATEDTFAVLRSSFEKIGRVLDISINGLAFLYLNIESEDLPPLQVDIFLTENGFHLSRIPCRIVYDISQDNGKTALGSNYRRCGLSFSKITETHKKKMKPFLKK